MSKKKKSKKFDQVSDRVLKQIEKDLKKPEIQAQIGIGLLLYEILKNNQ